jgi:hypothetical protein
MRLGFQQGESRTALHASSWDVFSAWTRLFHKVLLEMLGDAFDKWPYGDREANTEVSSLHEELRYVKPHYRIRLITVARAGVGR